MILTVLNLLVSLGPSLGLVMALEFIAVRHQRLFLTLFMFLTALECTRDFAPTLVLTISGISIYPTDLFIVTSAGAALVRIGKLRTRWITSSAVFALVLIVGLGVITWIQAYGIQLGTNSWRDEMLNLALLAYVITRPRRWVWDDLRAVIIAPAILLGTAAFLGFLLHGIGSSSSTTNINGVLEGGRPVDAPGSLLMLIAIVLVVIPSSAWGAQRVTATLFLGSMVLLTQNRSVWVAGILGVGVWWLLPRAHRRLTSRGLGGVSRTIVVFWGVIAMGLIGSSIGALGQSASSDDTWLWRVTRWTDSMNIARSWGEWLVGSAFGPTPASAPGLFPTVAHSLYVDAIEKSGIIGIAAILCLVIALGKAPTPPRFGRIGLVVCFIFLGYGAAYQLPAWAWMLTGILLAGIAVEQIDDQKAPPIPESSIASVNGTENRIPLKEYALSRGMILPERSRSTRSTLNLVRIRSGHYG